MLYIPRDGFKSLQIWGRSMINMLNVMDAFCNFEVGTNED